VGVKAKVAHGHGPGFLIEWRHEAPHPGTPALMIMALLALSFASVA
jgi:hypothetical protein